jgi:hypothetical protein
MATRADTGRNDDAVNCGILSPEMARLESSTAVYDDDAGGIVISDDAQTVLCAMDSE